MFVPRIACLAVVAVSLSLLQSPGFGSGEDPSVLAHGYTETIILNLGGKDFARGPECGVIQGSDGNFYGSTREGGVANQGAIFRTSPDGRGVLVHSFGDGGVDPDGAEPVAAPIEAKDGNFYGTTTKGGSKNRGAIYKITPSGDETIIHSFVGNPDDPTDKSDDGADPEGALIQGQDGNLYGTTMAGGGEAAIFGTVFKVTPEGVVSTVYAFKNIDEPVMPECALVEDKDGNFYGTSERGGNSYGGGTIFKLTPDRKLTILHSFHDGSVPDDGVEPDAGLLLASDGNFYGTTDQGGASKEGIVFKMTPTGKYTILHSFLKGYDGGCPGSALVEGFDGALYGSATSYGAKGFGVLFRITKDGDYSVIHSFGDGTVQNDGIFPEGPLFNAADGSLYGTTSGGGTEPYTVGYTGTVFKITPPRK